MASHIICQRYLLVVFCIALVFASGLASGFNLPGLDCGKVSNRCDMAACSKSCGSKGGSCYGIVPGAFACCCHK
ncbi:hypothetical protein VNO77_19485 [Canavalia gladiata]|uniref:Uncharacterized protein n=1 Tax=Canavalia gladiata TaxID=3824 RepID=A0AAN9LMV1_CANGL